MDSIGGRKVVVALIILLIGVGIVLYRGDVPANLLVLLQTVFAAFVVGNGIENVVKSGVSKKKVQADADIAYMANNPPKARTEPAPAPYVTNLESAVQDIETKVDKLQESVNLTQASLDTSQQALGVILGIATAARDGRPQPQ